MGQAPPGATAEVFAGGILKPDGGFHSSIVFNSTADGPEATVIFSAASAGLADRWAQPVKMPANSSKAAPEAKLN